MLLTVLSVPDCPNTPLLLDHLHGALAGQPADLDTVVVEDLDAAWRWGMAGSPTLLVDGRNPFDPPGMEASISCRLHRDAEGNVSGAPSVSELRVVLSVASEPFAAYDERRWFEVLGRGGRGRLAPAEGGLRAVQQALLREMARCGRPPEPAAIDRVAERHGRRGAEVLSELADQDFVSLGHGDNLRAIYPFSVVASAHLVRIEGGPQVWAMCAIDALGIAPLIGRAVTVETRDPVTAEPISVHATPGGEAMASPRCVVFLGRRLFDGPAVEACCDAINLFGSPHTATRWAVLHPDVPGRPIDLEDAARLGRQLFGKLLADV